MNALAEELVDRFEVQAVHEAPAASYNIAPTQSVAVITQARDKRILSAMRWGLVPSWAKDPSIGSRMINARAETIAEKPAYRSAFAQRRCLVPANGWYEWQGNGKTKQPVYFHRQDAALFAFAGLYETWQSPEGETLTTFTVITTTAFPEFARFHERTPAALRPEDEAAWLTPGRLSAADAFSLLTPLGDDVLEVYPVSMRVNSPKNDDSSLVEPLPPTT